MASFDNTTITGQISAIDATYPKPNVNQSSDGFRINFAAIKGSLSSLNNAVVNLYKNAPLAFSTDSMIIRRANSAASISDLVDGMTLNLDLRDIHGFTSRVFDSTNSNMQITIDGKGRVIAISSSPLPTINPSVSLIPQRTMNSGAASVATIQLPTFSMDTYGRIQNVSTTNIGPFGILGHDLASGSLIVGNTANVSSALTRGTTGQVLKVSASGALEWVTLPPILAGTVTNVYVGNGLVVQDGSVNPLISLDFKSFSLATTIQSSDNLISFDSTGTNYKKFTFSTLVSKLGETFIGSLFGDTAPKLGADLNVNGFNIVNGSATGSIRLFSDQAGKIILNANGGDIEIQSNLGVTRLLGTVAVITQPLGDNTTSPASTEFVKRGLDLKLNLSGGFMSGALILSGAPTLDLHATTKRYVDDGLFLKFDKTGGVISGDVTVSGLITLTGTPTANQHAVTKSYTDTALALKVNLTGGTMTGLLTLSGAPTSNLHAATKLYVDNLGALKLNLTGGTLTGALTLSGAPTVDLHAATKKYVDDKFAVPVLTPLLLNSTTALVASHAGRMLIANSGTTLTVNWNDTGDGFNCIIINRTGGDLGFTLTNFTSSTPVNPDGFTRIQSGGVVSVFTYSPDGGTTKVFQFTGSGAP